MSEIVVWIIFFVFYLIFQVLGNKKRPKPGALPPGPADTAEAPSRPASLEEALREIQEALRQPREKSREQSEEPNRPRSLPSPEPVRTLPPSRGIPQKAPQTLPQKLPQRATSTDFHSLESPTRESVGLERSLELAPGQHTDLERTHWEEPVARRKEAPRPVEVRPSSNRPTATKPITPLPEARPAPAHTLRAQLSADLKNTAALQRAWLLKEVLEEPAYKRLRGH